jgi:hypothetical protein
MIRMLKSLYLIEGIRGWYRGILPAMIGSYPGQAIHYVGFEVLRDALRKKVSYDESSPLQNFFKG